ncbi:MAG: hypothetical protein U0X73_01795 [Thermoanaerobaculia bacterium]
MALSPALGATLPSVAGALLLAVAAALAWRAQRRNMGGRDAAVWIGASTLGSALPWIATGSLTSAVAVAGVAVAGTLLWGQGGRPAVAGEEIYSGPLPGESGPWRYVAVGAGLGCAVATGFACLPLVAPAIAALPPHRRRRAAAALALGLAAVVLAGATLFDGLWDPPRTAFSPALFLWATVDLWVGRGLGLLIFFLPFALALGSSARGGERRGLLTAVAAALAIRVLAYPFDLGGAADLQGNAAFAPLAAALWFAPARPLGRWLPLGALVVALPLVLPSALASFGAPPLPRAIAAPIDRALAWLPIPTTQAAPPATVGYERDGARWLGATPEVALARPSDMSIAGGRWGELALLAPGALSSLRLAFEPSTPATVELRGGELGNTTFRPSGEEAIDLRLGAPARRHPVAWSAAPVAVYRLSLRVGTSEGRRYRFAPDLLRAAVPAAGESR